MRLLKRHFDLWRVTLCMTVFVFPLLAHSNTNPRIQHKPVRTVEAGMPIRIEVTPGSPIESNASLLLYSRPGGSKTYKAQIISKSNGSYTIELPGRKTDDILEYFLLLVVDGKKVATHPENHPYIRPHKIIISAKSTRNPIQGAAIPDELVPKADSSENDLSALFGTDNKQSSVSENLFKQNKTPTNKLNDLFKKTDSQPVLSDDLFKQTTPESKVSNDLFTTPSSKKNKLPENLFAQTKSKSDIPDRLFALPSTKTGVPEKLDRIQNSTSSSDITMLVLSPEPESKQNDDQVVIAISFLAEEGRVDERTVQLFLDRENVTKHADVSEFLVSYTPQNIVCGKHQVKMLARNLLGQALMPVEFSFWIRESRPRGKKKEVIARATTIADKYQQAVDEFYFRNYKQAIEKMKSLLDEHGNHPLASNFQYWIGESYYGLKEYEVALKALQLVERYPKSNKADDALVMIGMCYYRLGQEKKSQQAFQKLLNRYPKSEYMKFARKMVK